MKRLGQLAADSIGDVDGLLLVMQASEQHHELIAAKARDVMALCRG